jgi:hypothetical protein
MLFIKIMSLHLKISYSLNDEEGKGMTKWTWIMLKENFMYNAKLQKQNVHYEFLLLSLTKGLNFSYFQTSLSCFWIWSHSKVPQKWNVVLNCWCQLVWEGLEGAVLSCASPAALALQFSRLCCTIFSKLTTYAMCWIVSPQISMWES